MQKRIFIALFLLLAFASCCAAEEPISGKQYTAYNLWYKASSDMDCVNQQSGTMLPAGTEVKSIEIITDPKDNTGLYIFFAVADTRKTHRVYYYQGFHPKRSIQDYRNAMFTNKTFSELTQGMTADEISAIKRGAIVRGMSKKAVIVAAGLPSDHKTPSLEGNKWFYWKNQLRHRAICFDSAGMTTPCSGKSNIIF